MPTTLVRFPSTPMTPIHVPSRLALAARISDTTSTPGAFATAAAALFVTGLSPALTA